MEVIQNILWYLVIGCALDLFYVQVESWLKEQDKLKGSLTDMDRMISILLWPIGICYFIVGFIRSYFNDD
jgi:hypothetical protein